MQLELMGSTVARSQLLKCNHKGNPQHIFDVAFPLPSSDDCLKSEQMISDELRRFILTSIPSVPYLEAALLFHAEPGVSRTIEEVTRALYLRQSVVSQLLADMCEAGLLRTSDDEGLLFRYAANGELGGMIARLADEYRKNLIEVTHVIHNETQRSATRFAAAFELRKK